MAQPNAVQDQPSMEDILASIRRIIDDGNKKPAATTVPDEASIANDDVVEAKTPVTPEPMASASDKPATAEIGIPELDSFLESLDAKYIAQGQETRTAEPMSNIVSIDSVVENIAPAVVLNTPKKAVPPVAREASKYEARFSDTDRSAFAQVGNVLTATAQQAEKPIEAPATRKALISDNTRSAVGLSFEDLSAALMKEAGRNLPDLTEQMLQPMLSDWLDNNLPSMVERLVRAEIERIARGE